MGAEYPFISRQSVRRALENMLRGTPSDSDLSLLHLTLVDVFLIDIHIPPMEYPREFAVGRILSDLIIRELTKHRGNFGLPAPDEAATLADAKDAIHRDGKCHSMTLTGWSILYYRYVRADLNLLPGDYAEAARFDERTFRRIQADAIGRLADVLAEEERRVRLEQKRLRLLMALPDGTEPYIVGRDTLIAQTRQLLESNPSAHVLVTGPRGIGKSTFVQALLRKQIDANELDHVVWITQPPSVGYIHQYLKQVLLQNTSLDQEHYLAKYSIAIVIDGLQQISSDLNALRQWLNLWARAVVYLTNVVYLPVSPRVKHIVLPEIDMEAILTLVRRARPTLTDHSDLMEYAASLKGRVGGNPLAIQMAINKMNNLNVSSLITEAENVIESIVLSSYNTLSSDAIHVLLMSTFFHPEAINPDHLRTVWPLHRITNEAIIELISSGLLNLSGDRDQYRLPDYVAHWIERRAEQMGLSETISRLIDDLDQQILQNPASVYDVIEDLLIRQWPLLDSELALKWMRAGCYEGIRRGHYAEWATILKECSAYDMKLQYAICLRRLSERQAAQTLLEDLVRLTGQAGEFELQGRALMQLAILYRQRGYYQKAINVLDRAMLNAELTTDQKLIAELEQEYAKIELDSGQWQDALARLGNTTGHSDADTLSLMAEALMAAGRYDQALGCLEAAIHESQENALVLGRLYAAKGRLYANQGHAERAEEDLTAAIVILEQQSDWFALARAKSVLAATLITGEHDLEDAAELLRHAQDIQTEIMDRAGLVFTRRNLRELDRLSLTPNKKRLQS